MAVRIPEQNKKPGLCYAFTADGVELPVIDLTHPSFAIDVPDRAGMDAMVRTATEQQARTNRLPSVVRRPLFWLLARNSVLIRGILGANKTFLDGMTTYLMKLGPGNLGRGYAGKLDRTVASSLPAFSVRLRLRDAAQILAGSLAPLLEQRPGFPLHFINIAGGPCSDSLNALILLRKEHPGLLTDRAVSIHVYDLDRDGPAFAARATDALKAPGAPLEGLNVALEHRPYDWREPGHLRNHLAKLDLADAVVVASSEGGLGDYGTDEAVRSNLEQLAAGTPDSAALMLTITPVDGPAAVFNQHSVALSVPRPLEAFIQLAAGAGWAVVESRKQPLNIVVALRKA